MTDADSLFDQFLSIDTSVGIKDDNLQRKIFTQYQPAHYPFLEYLYQKYPFSDKDCLVDFGAGKGRPLIMAAYYGCKHIIAYEVDYERTEIINNNIHKFVKKFNRQIQFAIYCNDASNASINKEMNKFFFFSPFHLKIYIRIIKNIISSLDDYNRIIFLYLYGPDESVIDYINTLKCFKIVESMRYIKFVEGENNRDYYDYVIYSNI